VGRYTLYSHVQETMALILQTSIQYIRDGQNELNAIKKSKKRKEKKDDEHKHCKRIN